MKIHEACYHKMILSLTHSNIGDKMTKYIEFNEQNYSFLVIDSLTNKVIERITLDSEQESMKVIRLLQVLDIDFVHGSLPFSLNRTVNFVLLKEQAETIRKYLLKGKEDGRLNDTYSISRVISTIDEALGKVENK
ncbi:MAG: hypothetical protein ACRD5J_10020 [Nitrososphaeraceae archaeon]